MEARYGVVEGCDQEKDDREEVFVRRDRVGVKGPRALRAIIMRRKGPGGMEWSCKRPGMERMP